MQHIVAGVGQPAGRVQRAEDLLDRRRSWLRRASKGLPARQRAPHQRWCPRAGRRWQRHRRDRRRFSLETARARRRRGRSQPRTSPPPVGRHAAVGPGRRCDWPQGARRRSRSARARTCTTARSPRSSSPSVLGTDRLSLMVLVLVVISLVVRQAIGERLPGLGQQGSNRALGDAEDLRDVRSRPILEVVQRHDLRLPAGKPSHQPPELGEVLRQLLLRLAAATEARQPPRLHHHPRDHATWRG